MNENQLYVYKPLFDIIKKALWNNGEANADKATYDEMNEHSIAPLAAPILSQVNLPDSLYQEWKKTCIDAFIHNSWYRSFQETLPITVPYVILKGTAAAQYYPHPEYRMMGDVDIMTSHENFRSACDMLLDAGFDEHTNAVDMVLERHREFNKNGFIVEVHSFYALRDSVEETKTLDELIIDGINQSHVLPDPVNGLTLIEHINHHMESGLGLRQVIDWMMFVDKCLPDEKWQDFKKLAERTGHVQLSIVTTRMCEIYLGLSEHAWCSKADPELCAALMEYVLSCGNFGRKKGDDTQISEYLLSDSSLKAKLKTLRQRGMITWGAAQKYPFLRPLAGVYQAVRYICKGLSRNHPIKKIGMEYVNSKKRNALFNNIGVSRETNGRVIYKNGQYKTNKK